MSNFVLISYVLSTILSAGVVYAWRKFSSNFVDTFILAVCSWLSFLSVFNLFGMVQ